MIKYYITKESVEVHCKKLHNIKDIENYIISSTLENDRDCREIAVCDSLEEAKKTFEKHKEDISPIKEYHYAIYTWSGDMLCIVERDEDEDGYYLTEDIHETYIDMDLISTTYKNKSEEGSND